jgi:hypothetical protein
MFMKRTFLMLLCGVVLLGSAGAVYAHHSFTAAYDNTKRVEVEGVVKEFIWRNPHSFLRIDVTNKEGKVELWSLEWGSSSQLSASKYPVTRTSIKFGDKIVAAGEPRRDPSVKGLRVFSIKRPVDGWMWEGVVD